MIKQNVFAATGISKSDDPALAGQESVQSAIKQFQEKGGKTPDFGLVFCSGGKFGQDNAAITKLVSAAHQAFISANPKCKWVGCTTAGEISDFGVTEGTCVALALSSEFISVGLGFSEKAFEKPDVAGRDAARAAIKDLKVNKYLHSYINFLANKQKEIEALLKHGSYYIITLFPGSSKDSFIRSDDILRAIKEETAYKLPILGGNAGDDFKLAGNYQFCNGKVYKNTVICIALVSDIIINYAADHGYAPIGKPMMVTKSVGSLIVELDGKPALDVYSKALKMPVQEVQQKLFQIGMQFPFGSPNNDGEYLIKAPGFVQGTSLLCAANVTQNSVVSIMKSDEKKILSAIDNVMDKAAKPVKNNISAVLIFSCAMRKAQLKQKVGEEFKKIQTNLGKGVPFIGLYTYGEQIAKGAASDQQNINFSALVISNRLVTE